MNFLGALMMGFVAVAMPGVMEASLVMPQPLAPIAIGAMAGAGRVPGLSPIPAAVAVGQTTSPAGRQAWGELKPLGLTLMGRCPRLPCCRPTLA